MNSIASGFIKNFTKLPPEEKTEIMRKFVDLAEKSVNYISNYFIARSMKKTDQPLNSETTKFKSNLYDSEHTTPRNKLAQCLLTMFQFEPDVSKKIQFLETMKFIHLQKDQTKDEKMNGYHIIDHMESTIRYPESYKINGAIKTSGMNTSEAMLMLDRLKNSSIDFCNENKSDLTDIQKKYSDVIRKFQSSLSDPEVSEKIDLINQMKAFSLNKNNSEIEQKNATAAVNYMQDSVAFHPYRVMISKNKSEYDKSNSTEKNHVPIQFSPELYERIRVSLLTPVDKQNYAQRTESFDLHEEISALRTQRDHLHSKQTQAIDSPVVNLQNHQRPRD